MEQGELDNIKVKLEGRLDSYIKDSWKEIGSVPPGLGMYTRKHTIQGRIDGINDTLTVIAETYHLEYMPIRKSFL